MESNTVIEMKKRKIYLFRGNLWFTRVNTNKGISLRNFHSVILRKISENYAYSVVVTV